MRYVEEEKECPFVHEKEKKGNWVGREGGRGGREGESVWERLLSSQKY